MASTYLNNLRLEEIGTGEQSGTWGDTTNTNLKIIGQAVAWGTRAIANASTDNITIGDGALDADRCLGLKLTGGGQACTVSLLPNTSSKTWFMYNATAAALTFTCGSGANVIIPAGHTKVIATDGLGSGGVVHDLLTAVNLAGTTTVDDLIVSDDLVVADDASVGGTLGVTGIATFTDDIIIGDGKTIGSASDVDAMSISSGGVVNFSARPTFAASLTVQDGGSLGSASDLNAVTISSGGVVAVTATTASTSSSTGALTVGGGMGVAADLFVGDDFDVTGDAVIDGTALVTGVLTTTAKAVSNGGIGMPDNAKLTFGGTGTGDLQIFHNGTDSVIQEAVNNRRFLIGGDEIAVRTGDLGEDMAKFIANGAAELYHNNVKKIETTATGVAITGGVAIGGTGAANTLDDYEEGTFTPAFVGTSQAPTFYNLSGKYTKIGRSVTAQLFIQTNANAVFNNTAASFLVSGFPFAVFGSGYTGSQGSVNGQAFYYHGANNNQSVVGTAATGGCMVTAEVNADEQMQFDVTNSGGTRGIVNNVGAAKGMILEATVTYFTT